MRNNSKGKPWHCTLNHRKSLQYIAIKIITQLPTCSKFVKGEKYFVDGEVTGFTMLSRNWARQSPSGPPGAQLKAWVLYQGEEEEEMPGNNKKSLKLCFLLSHFRLSLYRFSHQKILTYTLKEPPVKELHW